MSDVPIDPPPSSRRRSSSRLLRIVDGMTMSWALGGSLSLVALLALLVGVIWYSAYPAVREFGLGFFGSSVWNPVTHVFGAWPYIYSTLVTSVIALLISFPVSLGSALFLVKLGPKTRFPVPAKLVWWRKRPSAAPVTWRAWVWVSPRHLVTVCSFLIELLAAIPSIAYGFWGIAVLVPFMQHYLQPALNRCVQTWSGPMFLAFSRWTALPAGVHGYVLRGGLVVLAAAVVVRFAAVFAGTFAPRARKAASVMLIGGIVLLGATQLSAFFKVASQAFASPATAFNILTASIVLAIMVIPIVTAIIRDVLAVAPPEIEQGAFGLGATWWQAQKLVIRHSKMGIFGAVILGFARAMGETMAVMMVIGGSPPGTYSLFSNGETIASKLANQFNNADTDAEVHALVYMALILLLITALINGVARVILMRVTLPRQRK